jgi:dihydroxyacetone kinase-like protein
MPIQLADVAAWLEELDSVFAENREYLTRLDAAIGDADHGINMHRGFGAVTQSLRNDPPVSIAEAFKAAAMALIRTVGGASGPLYGTFFLRAATACQGKVALEPADVVALVAAGVEGVRARGRAEPGDKTMVDALLPALQAMEGALPEARGLGHVVHAGVLAARMGMENTVAMQARKGRASYLAERSIGHQDPGATSSYLMLKAAADVWV